MRVSLTEPPPLDLSRDWSVTFSRDQPPVTREALRSWTEDASTRHFSGVATYEKQVQLPEGMLAPGLRIEIDFGVVKAVPAPPLGRMQALVEAPVREAAVVYVNGRRAGTVWCPPYRIDVTGLLQAGENRIKVEVANLALNEMAGHPLPDYRCPARRHSFGDRFQAPGHEPSRADYRRPSRPDPPRRQGPAGAALNWIKA